MRTRLGLVTLVVLSACGEDPPWVGTYAATGTWKLAGPLQNGRTVGRATADLLIEEIISFSPVPSFLEDEIYDWLDDEIGGTVASTVDANVPKDLAPDGAVTKLLGTTLGAVKLESTIELGGDTDELEGNESVTAVEFAINGQPHRVAASTLNKDAGSIVSSWGGKEDGDTLTFDAHSVAIRYGELVRLLMVELVAAADLSALESGLTTALSCQAIVAAILDGKAGFEISIGSWSHTIGPDDLEALCAKAVALIEEKAAGQFELDTRVEVGGRVSWATVSGGSSIALTSASDFGGVVNIGPHAIAPRVDVSFTALKK